MIDPFGFFIDILSIILGFWPLMLLVAVQGGSNRKRKQKLWQRTEKLFREVAIAWALFALMWGGVIFFGKRLFSLISELQNSLLFWGIGGIVLSFWVLSLGFGWLKRQIEFEKMRELGAMQALDSDEFE